MAITTDVFNNLNLMLTFARLIEQFQNMALITASERMAYFTTLNSKVHSEIERLLALVEPTP